MQKVIDSGKEKGITFSRNEQGILEIILFLYKEIRSQTKEAVYYGLYGAIVLGAGIFFYLTQSKADFIDWLGLIAEGGFIFLCFRSIKQRRKTIWIMKQLFERYAMAHDVLAKLRYVDQKLARKIQRLIS